MNSTVRTAETNPQILGLQRAAGQYAQGGIGHRIGSDDEMHVFSFCLAGSRRQPAQHVKFQIGEFCLASPFGKIPGEAVKCNPLDAAGIHFEIPVGIGFIPIAHTADARRKIGASLDIPVRQLRRVDILAVDLLVVLHRLGNHRSVQSDGSAQALGTAADQSQHPAGIAETSAGP